MPTFTQANRPIALTTPLSADTFIMTGFHGQEAISRPFDFQIDCVASTATDIAFDKLLGQKINVRLTLADGKPRHIHGICQRVSQGERGQDFTDYRLHMVPALWLLSKRAQSRIFQQQTVPQILKAVLDGLDVDFQLQGTYEPRNYCVQYRETDFNFASRLMEEEGIFYFFTHSADSHKMIVADSPQSHPAMPSKDNLIYETIEGGAPRDDRILTWQKSQELISGMETLWDHSFELPNEHLDATRTVQDSAKVGAVDHKIKLGVQEKLEIYDFPGDYAVRFDGVDPGGGDQPPEVQKIFTDKERTVRIRSQQDAAVSVLIQGSSSCRNLISGHKFKLERHKDANGEYVMTSIEHSASMPFDIGGGGNVSFAYQAHFTCLPSSIPFRPQRLTPRPFVQGNQTATVVGPPGQEIFTDKYGRVKVQFHWDRQGKFDADSSCWVRVGQVWSGKRWGASFWPRIGQEVIVAFIEGNPDWPIIVGSVYNADQMPPYQGDGPDDKHPSDNKLTGVKSNSTPGGDGFNEWRFDDTKGQEQFFIHAERDIDTRIKHDARERVIHDRHLIIGWEKDGEKGGDQREFVYQDKHLMVKRNHIEKVESNVELTVGHGELEEGGNVDIAIAKNRTELIDKDSYLHVQENRMEKIDKDEHLTVGGNRTELIKGSHSQNIQGACVEQYGSQALTVGKDKWEKVGGDHHHHVVGARNEKVEGTQSLSITADQQEKVGGKHALDAGQEIHLKSGMKIIIEAGAQLSLKGPGGFIDIGPAGVTIQGTMVLINSGGAAGAGSGSSPTAPKDPAAPEKPKEPPDAKKAQPKQPDLAGDAKTGAKSAPK